jgi:hypothetical protein
VSLRVAGIQPGYLPWLGYFDQMRQVDLFVIADQMPYSSTGWTHRNRVRGANGPIWLRLPVRPHRGDRIDQVEVDRKEPWRRTHLRSLQQAYARSRFAAEEIAALGEHLPEHPARLVDVVLPSLDHLIERLAISTPVVRASDAGLEEAYDAMFPGRPGPSHQIVAYLTALGADQLLEGASGAAFLDVELLRRHGIEVAFHQFDHPCYPQLHEGFVSHLSVVDLLLSVGPDEARRILHTSPVAR